MKKKMKSGLHDYMKAIKKADREQQLEQSVGFKAVTKVHISKKSYKRREGKRIDFDTLSSFFIANRVSIINSVWC